MRDLLLIIATLLCFSTAIIGQSGTSILTDGALSVEELVRDVFLKGNCINITNIEPIGNLAGIGRFYNGSTAITVEEGIIIATGEIENAHGPNQSKETSTRFNDTRGDKDLVRISTNSTEDAVGIEFDFTPFGNTVSFEYVFASEEYCEFVGSIYNDVFGFFVSGPGLSGPFSDNGVNVALIPGTEEFVSINNVNHEDNSSFYVKNERQEDATQCNINFGAVRLEEIEYDGFTRKLRATFPVIPCETYHIRLVVADVGDDKLDSAVFLAAKSFDLGETVSVRAEVPGSEELTLYEGCQNGQFVFERTRFPNTGPELTIDFTIHPNSTATNGADFEAISSTIIIPAQTPSVTIPIIALLDNLDEPPESVLLEISYPCDCIERDTAQLLISDNDPLEIDIPELAGCAGQDLLLQPMIVGGAAPFSYAWSTTQTDTAISVPAMANTDYSLTVTDFCGNIGISTVTTDLRPPPQAVISGNTTWCVGDNTTFLPVELMGRPPFAITYQVGSNAETTVSGITENSYNLAVQEGGKYVLTNVRDASCNGEVSGVGVVEQTGVALSYQVEDATCAEVADGSINLELTGGERPYQIQWDTFVNDEQQPNTLSLGNYTVRVTDASGCIVTVTIPVRAANEDCSNFRINPRDPGIYIPNAFSPNGDGINDEFRIFPKASTVRTIQSLQIFDRWGVLVFETRQMNVAEAVALPAWDGYQNGQLLKPGVYTCVVKAGLINGVTTVLTSDVTLVR